VTITQDIPDATKQLVGQLFGGPSFPQSEDCESGSRCHFDPGLTRDCVGFTLSVIKPANVDKNAKLPVAVVSVFEIDLNPALIHDRHSTSPEVI
jgi:hypothetical protein